ncbi:hypothetical protein VTJ04DRAFT_2441 [Mycothermus thermophilus]|uniref:uncharacterized protein n=1 Tax=Humicola insolens TaxID=85995 RepID=UPI003742F358
MQRSQQLRTATQTRRGARGGYPEPDDFEGLPIRQWRQEWVTIAPATQQDENEKGDIWAVELPFGMPRETHLLPQHSQELLRLARSGRLYKRPAPIDDDDVDYDMDVPRGDKKDWEPPNEGYQTRVWKQVPRNAEGPEISYLAKRPKNTITLASRTAVSQPSGPTVIRATVRRIDAAGNPYEQTVTLTEGQQVDGEIISQTVVPAPVAQQQELPIQPATPARRRPPPPKRKPKGPGRGRKKGKLPLPAPTTRSHAATAEDGTAVKSENVGPDGAKLEDTESLNQDSEMADASAIVSEDEEGEGEGGEGDEEEEGDEEGGDEEAAETPDNASAADARGGAGGGPESEDTEMTDAAPASTSVEEAAADAAPSSPGIKRESSEEVSLSGKPRFPPPALAPPLHHTKLEGSPLKNVMVLSPTEPSPKTAGPAALSGLPPTSSDQPASAELPAPAVSAEGSTTEPKPEPTTASTEPAPAAEPSSSSAAAEPPAAAAAQPESTEPPAPVTNPGTGTGTGTGESETDAAPLQPPDSPNLLPTNVTAGEDEEEGLNTLELEDNNNNKDGSGGGGGNSNDGSRSGSEGKVEGENKPASPSSSVVVSQPEPEPAASASEGGDAAVAEDPAKADGKPESSDPPLESTAAAGSS